MLENDMSNPQQKTWQKTWQKTPDTLSLSNNHVDIWLCDLKLLSDDINYFYSILSEDECLRADKLKVEEKKQQYIIARGCLRQRLSLLTNIEPEDFVFKTLEHGKPVLNCDDRFVDITFNISHSHDLALIAISQKQNIGIDIEKINHESDHQALVTRFFSETEQSEFQTIEEINKAKAFCACWTRKEAFIKAIGDGITYGLDTFDVTVDPDIQTPNIKLHKPASKTWSAQNLSVGNDYMGCLVSDAPNANIRYWQ